MADNNQIVPIHEPMYRVFYYESMLFNTTAAKISCEKANDLIELIVKKKIGPQDRKDEVLDSLQNFINQAAAISKYFWLSGKNTSQTNNERAKKLKKVFELDDESPLRLRKIRNSIEHYDERLDEYLAKGILGVIIPSAILEGVTEDEYKGHLFRAYDIYTKKFYVLGEELYIIPLLEEMQKIHNKLLELTGRA